MKNSLLIATLAVALVGCLLHDASFVLPPGGNAYAADDATPRAYDPRLVSQFHLACLTRASVEAVRARPSTLTGLYRKCEPEIARDVPFARSKLQRHAVLAGLVAYAMAPYGPSTAVRFSALLHDRVLDCDNYAMLAWWLHRSAWGAREASRYVIAGWVGLHFGNHAQTMVDGLVIDSTLGLVAPARYWQLRTGGSVRRVVDFGWRRPSDMAAFHYYVIRALLEGRYQFARVLYVKPTHTLVMRALAAQRPS